MLKTVLEKSEKLPELAKESETVVNPLPKLTEMKMQSKRSNQQAGHSSVVDTEEESIFQSNRSSPRIRNQLTQKDKKRVVKRRAGTKSPSEHRSLNSTMLANYFPRNMRYQSKINLAPPTTHQNYIESSFQRQSTQSNYVDGLLQAYSVNKDRTKHSVSIDN
jgi:hypothetical protein